MVDICYFLRCPDTRIVAPVGWLTMPQWFDCDVCRLVRGCVPFGFSFWSLQWMTAGRGILHAEMPCSEEPAHGLQLWVNLRSSEKMVEPRYQELKSGEIPKPTKDGVTVAVISGEALGVKVSLACCMSPVTSGRMLLHYHCLSLFVSQRMDLLQRYQGKCNLRGPRNVLLCVNS